MTTESDHAGYLTRVSGDVGISGSVAIAPTLPLITALAQSETRSDTGTSGPVDFTTWDVLTVEVNVTAVAGTPSMLVYIQTTYDGTNWTDVAVSTAITLVGRYVISTQPPGSDVYARQCFIAGDGTMPTSTLARAVALGVSVRVKWVITGSTPSLTFSVAGVLRRAS